MAHIVYDGKVYPLLPKLEERTRQEITRIIEAGTTEFVEVRNHGMHVEISALLVGPGIPIAINDWDVKQS